MSLYRTYRPNKLNKMVGNAAMLEALEALARKEEPPHAYLFSGPSGCGKTTAGRILAGMLGCSIESRDFREIDSADFRGIDTARDLRRNVSRAPMESKSRVWLLDECHKMTNDAQNALLKILEDPPDHAFFILCTTEPQKLIRTIHTRCSQFVVKELSTLQLSDLVTKVAKKEKKPVTKAVSKHVAECSLGSPRAALVILEQIIDLSEEAQMEAASAAAALEQQTIHLCRALFRGDKWDQIAALLRALDEEPEGIRRMVLGYCQSILLSDRRQKPGNLDRAYLIIDAFREPFYNIGKPGLTAACYEVSTS